MSSSPQTTAHHRQRWLDGMAVTASALCLVHCLLLPVLLIAMPVLATMLAVPEQVHAIGFVVAVPASVVAMVRGRRRHAPPWPFRVAGVGLVLLGIGAFAVSDEVVERMVTSMGAVLLAIAHVGNWRAVSHVAGARSACPAEKQA